MKSKQLAISVFFVTYTVSALLSALPGDSQANLFLRTHTPLLTLIDEFTSELGIRQPEWNLFGSATLTKFTLLAVETTNSDDGSMITFWSSPAPGQVDSRAYRFAENLSKSLLLQEAFLEYWRAKFPEASLRATNEIKLIERSLERTSGAWVATQSRVLNEAK